MTQLTVAAPVPVAGGGAAARVRRLFRLAGYDAPAVAAALNGRRAGTGGSIGLLDRRETRVHQRRLGPREDALALLIKLFLLSETVEVESAERQLGDIDALLTTGLVRESGAQLQGLVRIVPHDDLLLASDGPHSAAGAEHVPGVHRPSAALAHLTLRRQVGRALDLGTGLGIQALLLARHAERVVATDVNERALAFATFNAALNEVGNVEFRQGSFFEPLEGETFELAVCNPPYVISPASELTYRDGLLPRDGVSELVVRSLPTVLAVDGVATAMISWIASDDDLTAQPRLWAGDSGCDAILLCSVAEDALTAAASWNREARDDLESYTRRVDEWADYFASEGIEQIAYGALVLRARRSGSPWWSELRLTAGDLSPASTHLERLLEANDLLAAKPRERLLGAAFAVVPEARIDLSYHPGGAGWEAGQPLLRVNEGVPVAVRLDQAGLDVVRRFDGTSTLRTVLEHASQPEAPSRELEAGAVELVERLLQLGLVTAA